MAVRMGFRVAWLANEAREGALHAICAACRGQKLCAGGWRTANAAWGLLSSTTRRRRRLVDRDQVVDIRVDEPNVKRSGANREKGASG